MRQLSLPTSVPNPNPISIPSLLILLLPLLLTPSPAAAANKPSNAILLSEVRSLTFRGNGAQTAHRRVPAVPQLKCVSAPALCNLHSVDVMRCTNQGSGYSAEDIQWSCSAPLPPELKLGSTDVVCEGYTGPDDPYVLKGSCGVEYRLVLTEAGEQRFPDVAKGGGGWGWGGGGDKGRGSSGSFDPSAIAFAIIFALVCIWIIYSACVAGNQDPTRPGAQRRRRNNWGGFGGGFDPGFGPGGGGGGGGGWDDPPPPYPGGPKFSSTQNQGWRPGFWTGLAGGAAAAYAASGRRNNQQERNTGYGWGAGPSSSSSGGSGSRSTSSARYESTGFGSTSRR